MTSVMTSLALALFFFFNDTATTEIYTLSLHDALPILAERLRDEAGDRVGEHDRPARQAHTQPRHAGQDGRSEEHTSELQSHLNLVCRLLLEKKNNPNKHRYSALG